MHAPHFLAPRQLTKHRSQYGSRGAAEAGEGQGAYGKTERKSITWDLGCLGKRVDEEFLGKQSHLTSPVVPPGSRDLAEDKALPSWNKRPLLTPESG